MNNGVLLITVHRISCYCRHNSLTHCYISQFRCYAFIDTLLAWKTECSIMRIGEVMFWRELKSFVREALWVGFALVVFYLILILVITSYQ